MPELIDKERLKDAMCVACGNGVINGYACNGENCTMMNVIEEQHTIEAEPVRHGRWIKCDYKTLEHGEIESAYKAGLCCSECRTGFKKNRMTYKSFCPACGARMDLRTPTEVQLDEAGSVMMGGADNA